MNSNKIHFFIFFLFFFLFIFFFFFNIFSPDRYLDYGKTHPWVFNHNTHLWKQCQIHKKICWDPRFVSKFCKLFPFQSMKIVRLRLRAAEKLLQQEE